MKRYKNITEVWKDMDAGINIYWGNHGYKVMVSEMLDGNEYQASHFTRRGNQLLSIRCIENYFGGLMQENEISKLFSDAKTKKRV